MLLCTTISFCVYNTILPYGGEAVTIGSCFIWGALWLSGGSCFVCNCLPSSRAVSPLGLLGHPCVLSGSPLVLAAHVWLPCCVMSDLSLSLVSLGSICAPQIVFVARQLTLQYCVQIYQWLCSPFLIGKSQGVALRNIH